MRPCRTVASPLPICPQCHAPKTRVVGRRGYVCRECEAKRKRASAKRHARRRDPDPVPVQTAAANPVLAVTEKESAPLAKPEPADLLTALVRQLGDALTKVAAIENEIVKLGAEREKTRNQHNQLVIQDDVDLDVLSNLNSRILALDARLTHLADKLLDVQYGLQADTCELAQHASALWLTTHARLVAQAHAELAAILHPDVRPLRALELSSIAPAGEKVIEAGRRCEIHVHPQHQQPARGQQRQKMERRSRRYHAHRETAGRRIHRPDPHLAGNSRGTPAGSTK